MIKVKLTPEEQELLIWQAGDEIRAWSGMVIFSSKRVTKFGMDTPDRIETTFIFEPTRCPSDHSWSRKEWMILCESCVQNGHCLVVFYKRDKTYWPLGIISLQNGAWCANPFYEIEACRKSDRMINLVGNIVGGLSVSKWKKNAMAKLHINNGQWQHWKGPDTENIDSCLRMFMQRLARDPEQYIDELTRSGPL